MIAFVPSAIAPAITALKLVREAVPFVCALVEAFSNNDQEALKVAYVEMSIAAKRRALHAKIENVSKALR